MTTNYFDPTAGFHAFALQARTDAAGAAVDDAGGADLRAILAGYSEGILTPANGFKVDPDTNLDLAVGSGAAYTDVAILVGTDPGQGNYLARLGDDVTTVTLAAADLSNPRIDQVWLVVLDNQFDSSGKVLPRLAVTQGTPAASPAQPGPDGSWTAYILLASVLVGAGVTSIDAGDITDERAFAQLALAGGGSIPTGAVVDFLVAVPDGWIALNGGGGYSQAAYARLWKLAGPDGSAVLTDSGGGLFATPNLTKKVRVGAGDGLAVGDTGGSWNHTHTGPSHSHDPGTLAVPAHALHTHNPGTLAVPAHALHSHTMPHTHTFSDSFTTGGPSATTTTYVSTTPAGTHPTATHTHSGSVSGTTSAASSSTTSSDGPTTHGSITGATASDGPTSHGAITGATDVGGTGATGSANQAYYAVTPAIKT